ncbi:SAM hydrolase/SAM-dependent halogenase family protein [Gloeobacter kilaueensis]|uniref:S-adenosyl-l-methionine hydroxide adenosyltransferase n=1 Tax=Gloeobacter kilaueensis (strain ATCC BAA-2537 / CCAP 1431/1 / ULC 316 / JS1) TaxID=1183438 RepID=U5QMN0_GLOK1|nr:SAM-dependent chlorinase/fluorinase [Gloeobacter kilaueensis]AGY58910.1 hypothetical protein GKIL_2664 [Gloeobacter kilaueensis JS1]
MAIITLLSDFDLQDGYVAAMKGAIATLAPDARIIDITHRIPRQDVAAARFQLLTTCPYFPAGTIHVAVVDPGVGTRRRAIALRTATATFVGPDNGLFGGVLAGGVLAAVELGERRFWRTENPSTTFHGRDIFAPVAAHLASGVGLEQLGPSIDPQTLVELELPDWSPSADGGSGVIQAIDHFGNLITNIPAQATAARSWRLTVGEHELRAVTTYGEGELGEAVALVGSHGFIEIAVSGGSAAAMLALRPGDPVEFVWQEAEP